MTLVLEINANDLEKCDCERPVVLVSVGEWVQWQTGTKNIGPGPDRPTTFNNPHLFGLMNMHTRAI